MAFPPAALIFRTTRSAPSRSELWFTATAAPSFASDNAMPAPIPFDAPVTNATFPPSFPIHQSPRFDGHVPDMPGPHDRLKYMDLGQELVTRAMDRMKVLGIARLCF